MKNDGQIPWNAITICKMSKTCWQTGNLRYERRSGESFKGPIFQFDALVRYLTKTLRKNEARIHQFGKRGILLVMHHSRRNFGKYSDHWHWRIRKEVIDEVRNKYIKIYFRRLNAKEVLIIRRDDEFVFLAAGGLAKLSGRNYEFQGPTLGRESIA